MNTSSKKKLCFIALLFRIKQTLIFWSHVKLKSFLSNFFVYTGILTSFIGMKTKGLVFVLKGRRIGYVRAAENVVQKIIQNKAGEETDFTALFSSYKIPTFPLERSKSRILFLKLPVFEGDKVVEKGAIIVKFTETFRTLYTSLNTKLLSKYFRIILEPSWVGYCLPEILAWSALDEEVIVFSPYKDDFDFLSNVSTNLIPMTLGPADWVDSSIFYKQPNIKKEYDAIFLANFNPVKRVDRCVRAVVRITKQYPAYKIALVCAGHGQSKKEVLATLECAKDKSNIDLYSALTQSEINDLFNKSRVNVLVSLREGQNKGLAEGLFSGTPALLIKESAGGNHVHINEMTGKVVYDANLESALISFLDDDSYEPEKWANEVISPVKSTQKLNDQLKKIELSKGNPWTKDLFVKVNRPELNYLESGNAHLLNKRAEFLEQFSKNAKEEDIIVFLKSLDVNV